MNKYIITRETTITKNSRTGDIMIKSLFDCIESFNSHVHMIRSYQSHDEISLVCLKNYDTTEIICKVLVKCDTIDVIIFPTNYSHNFDI